MVEIIQWDSVGVLRGREGPALTAAAFTGYDFTPLFYSTLCSLNRGADYCECLSHHVLSLLLIMAGDVETNPGPSNIQVSELVDALADLVDWETFAIHLPKITSADIEKILRDHNSTDKQKFHLYSLWLERYPNASWNDVVQALKKVGKHTIAANIEKRMTQAATSGGANVRFGRESGHNQSDISSSTASRPHSDIVRQYMGDLMRVIGNPSMLAIDMWSRGLIPDEVNDEVTSSKNLSENEKLTKLLNSMYKSLRDMPKSKTKPLMIKFCEVLRNQSTSTDALSHIISKVMEELQQD